MTADGLNQRLLSPRLENPRLEKRLGSSVS